MPYVIQSAEEAVINSRPGQDLVDTTIRDAGVRIVGWAYSGFRVLILKISGITCGFKRTSDSCTVMKS